MFLYILISNSHLTMSAQSSPNLFKEISVGPHRLLQRVIMSPMTRSRALNGDGVPTDSMTTYYAQRATAPGTLLVTEGTVITERAGGYATVPGIWSRDQIAGWKKVTDAVHAKKSFIFAQLWALGRSASAEYLKAHGHDYVSASNIPLTHTVESAFTGKIDMVPPRPLTVAEIKEYVQDFAQAAKNAVEAGFDGVEIHGANGYIIEQFLKEWSNDRTDEYGGSAANRARFALEIVDAVTAAIGADRVGIRLSPFETYGSMTNGPGTIEQYAYVLKELELRALADPSKRLAYVHTVENFFEVVSRGEEKIKKYPLEFVRFVWSGIWIRTTHFSRATALEVADGDDKVIIGFGRAFLANPDLVKRLKEDLPINPPKYPNLYVGGDEGYIDYPVYDESKK